MKKRNIFLIVLTLFLTTFLLISCQKKSNKTIVNVETNQEFSAKELNLNVDFARRGSTRGRDVLANSPGVTVAYVEVNDINPLNLGSYYVKGETIQEEGIHFGKPKPFFDIVILFAANIRWDRSFEPFRPTIWFNDNWVSIMEQHEKYIQPLRDKGIKVLIDLLPDWDGVGFMNISETEDIEHFTDIMLEVYEKYNFDGFDMDEEYGDYENKTVPGKPTMNYEENPKKLFKRMREKLPKECMLTFFDYNKIGYMVKNDNMGEALDFAYANYIGGLFPEYPGFSRRRYSLHSIEGATPNDKQATNLVRAQSAVDGVAGVLMHWNMRQANEETAKKLSEISMVFYGKECEFDGNSYEKDYVKAPTGRLVKKGE